MSENQKIQYIPSISNRDSKEIESMTLNTNRTIKKSNVKGANSKKLMNGERLYMKCLAQSCLRQVKEKKLRSKLEDNYTYQPNLTLSKGSYNFDSKNYVPCTTINNSERTDFDKWKFTCISNTNKNTNKKVPLVKEEKIFNPKLTTIQRKEEEDLKEMEDYQEKHIKPLSKDELEALTTKLYDDRKQIEIKKQMLKDEIQKTNCPFTPEINSKEKGNISSFFIRLQSWINNINKKRNEFIKNSIEYDNKTGQKLFSPVVCKSSKKRENPFESLYEIAKNKDKEIENKRSIKMKNIKEKANSKKICKNSEEIFKKNKAKAIEILFKFFDDENNNNVKYSTKLEEKIKNNFSESIFKAFVELLNIMKEEQKILNKQEFFTIMTNFYNEMDLCEKNEILSWSNKKVDELNKKNVSEEIKKEDQPKKENKNDNK